MMSENALAAQPAAPMPEPSAAEDYVLLARLIRTQGRHGELLAEILTDFPERFTQQPAVWLLPPAGSGVPRAAVVERAWRHKGRIVLKLAGVDSMNDAEPLRGYAVAVSREQRMPLEQDAVYIGDLVGCRVLDTAAGGADLGPVLDVVRGEHGAADLLVLKQTGAATEDELLIPFAKSYIVSIDLAGRCLRMRLPAGLTALNAPLSEEERAALKAAAEETEE
jgi:16S rRNA processing protein RimM